MKKALAVAASSAALIACASATEKDAPPATAQYEIEFPSTAAAVVAESVQLLVFDAAQPDSDCQTLVAKRRSKQDLPPRLYESERIPPCELLKAAQDPNLAGSRAVLPAITFGRRSILAVALYDRGKDFMIGCGAGQLGPGVHIPVAITNANVSVPPPTTTCQSLSQKCSQQPPCQ